MNSTARTVLSLVIGLGLVAFFLVAAFIRGVSHDLTVTAFSLLTVFGLLQMAILSYAPSPRAYMRVVALAPVETRKAEAKRLPRPVVNVRTAGARSLKPTPAVAA